MVNYNMRDRKHNNIREKARRVRQILKFQLNRENGLVKDGYQIAYKNNTPIDERYK